MAPREPKVSAIVVRHNMSSSCVHNISSAVLTKDEGGYSYYLVVGGSCNLSIPHYDFPMTITIAYFDGALMADEAELYPFTAEEVEKAVRGYCYDSVAVATEEFMASEQV